EEKKTDGDIVDLAFDVVDGFKDLGIINGCLRSWSNNDGTLTTVAGGRMPEGAGEKIEATREKLGAPGQQKKDAIKFQTKGDLDLHKLTVADLQKEFPEFIGKEGEVFVGVNDKTLWLASGNESLAKLKVAIGQAKDAGAKPGPQVDLFLNFGPFVEL